jgi:hypothetical protein
MRLRLILACLLPALAHAQSGAGNDPLNDAANDAANDAESGLRLDVKPVLCVTDNRNPSCELSFLVTWESVTRGYYCVFNDFDENPLRCWEQAKAGQTRDERRVQDSFTFWMTGDDLESRLAEVAVEVLRLQTDDRRRRRRARHVWDLN